MDFDIEELEFEFELLNSEDGRIITLVCKCARELSPDEYAEAIRAFADRIESLCVMSEANPSTMN